MKWGLLVLAVAAALVAVSGEACADLIINMEEVGSDVVATASGTANLSALKQEGSAAWTVSLGYVWAYTSTGFRIFLIPEKGTKYTIYSGITGPNRIGPNGLATFATAGSGSFIGIHRALYLPTGYVSGSPLAATSTWADASIASLGLTPGTYKWTWGSGTNADSLTLNIGASPVPEPTTLALVGLGVVGLGVVRRRRR